jgi:hypothetical protein
MHRKFLIFVLLILFFMTGCNHNTSVVSSPETGKEVPVQRIDLSGAIADRDSEISGLAWYNDYLILLPQYPHRFDDKIFAIPKQTLWDVIQGEQTAAITPLEIALVAPGLYEQIEHFEGYESIAFSGEDTFLTIEASPGKMKGYVIAGSIESDLSQIVLDVENLVEIPMQSDIPNASDETILLAEDKIYTIYEGNGANVNPEPIAHAFDFQLNALAPIPFPNIEYRITDATYLDEDNRFWAINYFWPGEVDSYNPAPDSMAQRYGDGETHAQSDRVERLIELEYHGDGIRLVDRPPIQLRLLSDGEARNWEGIVRFDELGFIIATDKFPETILGFVEMK